MMIILLFETHFHHFLMFRLIRFRKAKDIETDPSVCMYDETVQIGAVKNIIGAVKNIISSNV